ncbi:putative serine esterase-domain-containing protein [Kockovaella imperatae]|uniref:Putative serine esterase-domain-containing protein n=1 Tax=Kockovaella imperatae TaxID=4999 RepID=A0A1Y1UFD6_9TREE|nr:putative serine esterase-domain-containing protein [Kockovaella imperatae]ORX36237.1 putative serine esterase-domain-containing protein [Kockovaella imperatae]
MSGSSSMAPGTSHGIHLVVIIHGLYGSPANLRTIDEEVRRAAEEATDISSSCQNQSSEEPDPARSKQGLRTVTLLLKSFTGSHTWDGIDVNAHKAKDEIMHEISALEGDGRSVTHISFMGYSLGGLVARYLVGLLHASEPSFFDTRLPVSFSTAATPHLGVLRYATRMNTVVHTIGRRLFSRSGQQMYCLDRYDGEESLLQVMADPESIFMEALQLFPRILIVANGCHDQTVPYPTASISLTDPFEGFTNTGIEVTVDHRNVATSWSFPPELDNDEVKTVSAKSNNAVKQYKGSDGVLRSRPRFPPFLILPYPFTYVLIVMIPILIPLWMITASSVLLYHSYQARQRLRLHEIETITKSAIKSSTSSLRRLAERDASQPDMIPTPRYRTRSKTKRSSELNDPDESTPLISRHTTPSSSSAPMSRTETPPLHDPAAVPLPATQLDAALPDEDRDEEDGPSSDAIPRPGQIPLLLTPAQKRMVRDLNKSLPQMQRMVAWFPWAFNSHALIVARDTKRFAWHEEGRGVVRAWAEFVVESARNKSALWIDQQLAVPRG